MRNEEFEKILATLNPAQRQAVETTEGAVMVIAGPGTGKTQILTLRIANILLKSQVNPENILALTYTESGVAAMRKRLVSITGNAGYRVDINTFHGFCNEVIKAHPQYFPRLIASDNALELDQIQIIEEFIENTKLEYIKPFGEPFYYVRPILSALDELKKEGISAQKLEEGLQRQEADFEKDPDRYHTKGRYKGKMKGEFIDALEKLNKNKELAKAYVFYEESLSKRKLYDFNDMLLEVVKAMEENEEFLMQLQEKYQYLLVDEHQDTNATQNKIVELLSRFYENPNLFVVGDEKQAIFRFQGASLENFLYFKNLYPDAVLVNLSHNYRSTQTILDAAGSLIQNNKQPDVLSNLPNSSLVAQAGHSEESIKVIQLHDYYGEYAYIVSQIKALIDFGVIPSEIAVLAKENKDLSSFTDFFKNSNILFVNESTQNILDDIQIQKVILLFKTIYQIGSDEELIKAMHIDFLHISPLDIYKIRAFAYRSKIPVWDVLSSGQYETELSLSTVSQIKNVYQLLLSWKVKSSNERFDVFAKEILMDCGFWESVLSHKNSIQTVNNCLTLFEEVNKQVEKNPNFTLKDFLDFIDRTEKHSIRIRSSNKVVKREAVRLMTVHGSKGLEFDYVFILHAFDGHWGNGRKRGTSFSLPWEYLTTKLLTALEEDKNEDERRLFYVALTRARYEIYISYSTHGQDGKEQVPTQFIEEINAGYKKTLSAEDFEKEFLDKKHEILFVNDTSHKTVRDEFLLNKEYFIEAFKSKGFSATHLNDYLTCPWRYFFCDLINIPYTYEKSLAFGSAVHIALSSFINGTGESKHLKNILSTFVQTVETCALSQSDKDDLIDKGKRILRGYYDARMVHWPGNAISEFDIKGVRFSEDIMLNGRIDMVWPVDNTNFVHVFDFKTGKPKSRNQIEGNVKDGDGNYKRQLVFYKLLMDSYKYKNYEMQDGTIEFIEPNDSGIYKQEVFTITPEEIEELKSTIAKVTKEILEFDFWDMGCKKPDCEYCKLHSYMGV